MRISDCLKHGRRNKIEDEGINLVLDKLNFCMHWNGNWEDLRWWWELHPPPPRTNLETEIIVQSSRITSWSLAEENSCNQGFTEEGTPKLVGRAEMQKELALFLWAEAEVPEGYLSYRGLLLRSKGLPKPGFPAQNTRAGKRSPHNIWLWKAVGFLSVRKRWDTGTFLKGQHTKFHSQPFTLGSSRGRAGWTRVAKESLGFVALARELEGPLLGSLCWVILPYCRCHLSYVQYPLCVASSWGKAIFPPSGLPLAPPCEAYTLLRSIARSSSSDRA